MVQVILLKGDLNPALASQVRVGPVWLECSIEASARVLSAHAFLFEIL